MTNRQEIEDYFQSLQNYICVGLEKLDGTSSFHEDIWNRPEGGGGRTRVLNSGELIEKGGVNFSAVHGDLPVKIGKALKIGTGSFFATGVSIVIHPVNPWVPIIHMNVRYFEVVNKGEEKMSYWFGGGIDLTPHYITRIDGQFIHKSLKNVCDATDSAYYQRFKKWADDYFYLKHREETRGVGGIFYDRLTEDTENHSFDELWQFQQKVGESFLPIYTYYAQKYRDRSYTQENKNWQLHRRGRYVEFNLVWDKGTKFGLDTNGRTESILMSMPPLAKWDYNVTPANHTAESETLKWLKKDINWLSND